MRGFWTGSGVRVAAALAIRLIKTVGVPVKNGAAPPAFTNVFVVESGFRHGFRREFNHSGRVSSGVSPNYYFIRDARHSATLFRIYLGMKPWRCAQVPHKQLPPLAITALAMAPRVRRPSPNVFAYVATAGEGSDYRGRPPQTSQTIRAGAG